MCAKCENKSVHVRETNWRSLAAQGLWVNAVTTLMMSYSRRGGSISATSARYVVNDYIKWLAKLERP